MSYRLLSDSSTKGILGYLDCPVQEPSLRYLNRLIQSHIRKVPWESVSRIVKRRTTRQTKDCPRWPGEFWQDAIGHGFGGTCFESSLAFYSLLMALGYKGYLTVNDMGTSRGCHAAIVILLEGLKYLVDVTIPVHSAVRFDRHQVTRRQTSFYDYTIRPVRGNVYKVEHSHHPSKDAFTLIDIPVSLPRYRRIVEDDYAETGRFLNSVVMAKVIGGKTWRFFSDHKPYKLESFDRAGKNETLLEPGALACSLARVFQMPEDRISTALTWIKPASQIL